MLVKSKSSLIHINTVIIKAGRSASCEHQPLLTSMLFTLFKYITACCTFGYTWCENQILNVLCCDI